MIFIFILKDSLIDEMFVFVIQERHVNEEKPVRQQSVTSVNIELDAL